MTGTSPIRRARAGRRPVDPRESLIATAERQERLGDAGRHAHVPSPAVRTESLLNPSDHFLEDRQRRAGLAAPHEVAADVELRADLDVADLVVPAEGGGLPVELQRAGEVPQLLVESTQAVGDPADVEVALPLPGLDEGLVEHCARFRIEAAPDVGQAQASECDALVELVVDALCLMRRPALDLDGLVEFTPPVMEESKVEQAVQVQVGSAERLTEADRLLQHLSGLVHLSVAGVHGAAGGKRFGQESLVPDLPTDGHGLVRVACRHGLVLPQQRERTGEREIGERLALQPTVAGGAGQREHVLQAFDRLDVLRHHHLEPAPPLVDFEDGRESQRWGRAGTLHRVRARSGPGPPSLAYVSRPLSPERTRYAKALPHASPWAK